VAEPTATERYRYLLTCPPEEVEAAARAYAEAVKREVREERKDGVTLRGETRLFVRALRDLWRWVFRRRPRVTSANPRYPDKRDSDAV
jgi:hypothetical protein